MVGEMFYLWIVKSLVFDINIDLSINGSVGQ